MCVQDPFANPVTFVDRSAYSYHCTCVSVGFRSTDASPTENGVTMHGLPTTMENGSMPNGNHNNTNHLAINNAMHVDDDAYDGGNDDDNDANNEAHNDNNGNLSDNNGDHSDNEDNINDPNDNEDLNDNNGNNGHNDADSVHINDDNDNENHGDRDNNPPEGLYHSYRFLAKDGKIRQTGEWWGRVILRPNHMASQGSGDQGWK